LRRDASEADKGGRVEAARRSRIGKMPELSEEPVFSLVLVSGGADRLRVMAEIRAIRHDLTPTQAKELLARVPQVLVRDVTFYEGMDLVRRFRRLGADVELRTSRGEYVYEHYRDVRPPKPYPG
jgi:ribosomal protein L7/L12